MKVQMNEHLDIDLEKEMWVCRGCGKELISARKSYQEGCLVYDRDPTTIHNVIPGRSDAFCPDPNWVRYLEFYCPGCGIMMDVQPLPPGHPITKDMLIDIDSLRERFVREKGTERSGK